MVGGSEFNLLEMLKVSDSDLDSLPDDMLNQILIRIPAQDILDSTMFVCRKWFEIIRSRSFIYTHLHHSTPGLLLHNPEIKTTPSFMSSTQGNQFKISKLFSYNNNSKDLYFWNSCNGLMLERNIADNLQLTITNPLTKQCFDLPPFMVQHKQYPTRKSAIAYDATRMEYKVVRTYYQRVHTYNPTAPKHLTHDFCAILTVGVDSSWRHVDTKHLSLATCKHLKSCPLVTEGFVHWTREYPKHVLTLNIETEIITKIPVPIACKGWGYYFTGGSYLSLLICRGRLKVDVWEMKPETGEWSKLPDIDLEDHKALLNESCGKEENMFFKPGEGDCLDCKLIPAGWLKYREVIVFAACRPNKGGRYARDELRAVYNVQTRDITLFKLAYSNYTPFLVHKKSLVRIPY